MSSAVSLIRSPDLAAAPYAYAATAPAGSRLIFLAGACPLEDDGTTTAPGDYAAQASRCLETLEIALRASGATLADVISTRVLVASSSQAELVTAWDVIHEAFAEHDVPSTLMGVTVLGYDNQLVEVEAIAAVAEESR
ncbi:RidA family protein [Microbacterium hydrocarbonoxydans]|uniref:Enamine deaminase RidA, house cleaning of reactive enamine intermediates, YjgF/YER057c/UK114 family n=1 Tax=Microbacterium hydrocarbonoxydans TaxID=273678 RepID=A0A1H4KYW8_9MICO|nr:Rid family hydrolase [Microbacterium hydrocarbonoxydans]SEB63298.1 Enamine deaminase RidA, house cleaning of reactive enamine intermediates, YjgF/YER057c/UK114 family [Microbacterium hydrocarbonoxydans]